MIFQILNIFNVIHFKVKQRSDFFFECFSFVPSYEDDGQSHYIWLGHILGQLYEIYNEMKEWGLNIKLNEMIFSKTVWEGSSILFNFVI